MKRLVFLVASVFIFFACENDLEFDKATDSPSLQTKSASVIDDPISQLREQQIPINIILSSSGSNNGYYLSVPRKRPEVDLTWRDDDSGRQKWLLESVFSPIMFVPMLKISGGVSEKDRVYLSVSGNDNTKLGAVLAKDAGYGLVFENIQGTSLYNIRTQVPILDNFSQYGYLGAENTSGMGVY